MKIILLSLLLIMTMPLITQAAEVGSPAPDFNLENLSGGETSLGQLKGKVVFLDFWAPWCTICREELPELDRLSRKFRQDGLVVIGIDVDDSEAAVKNFLAKTPLSFTLLIDKRDVMRKKYRFRTLPTAFIIGKDGMIRYVHIGFGNEYLSLYEREIIELLKQP